MNKSDFLKLAPQYYALAIAAFARKGSTFAQTARTFSTEEVANDYISKAPYEDDDTTLDNDHLFAAAIRWLTQEDMIEVIDDDFGPMVFQSGSALELRWEQLTADQGTIFGKWTRLGSKKSWLTTALGKINEEYKNLRIQPADFAKPDREWEPLPLDRQNDAQLNNAISAIEDTVAQARADNGYSANEPQERDYVLDLLTTATNSLKISVSTSIAYLRVFAFQPLGLLLMRFKGTALAIVATAAKEALTEWLKQQGISILDLFK